MSADTKITPREALGKEVSVKRAPVITSTELLGRKVPEFGGLNLSESPIHGFRIERSTGIELLAIMPEARLGSDAFLNLLHAVAPEKESKEPNRYGVIDDYRPMDTSYRHHNEALLRLHTKLGKDWADFMQHFSLFGKTLIERDEDIIKEIVKDGNLGGGGFDFRGLEIDREKWAIPEPITLSVWRGSSHANEADLKLRKVYSRLEINEEDDDDWGKHVEYFDDSDPARKSLKLELKLGSNLKISFNNTFTAEAYRVFSQFNRGYSGNRNNIFIDELVSTNVLVPTFRLEGNHDARKVIIDPVLEQAELGLLDEYVEGYSFSKGLRFDRNRFNPLAGLITMAHLSPEITANWPEKQAIGKSRPNMMGAAQVPVLALQRRGELANSQFAQALAEHVEKHAK